MAQLADALADDLGRAVSWCDQDGSYETPIASVSRTTIARWATMARRIAAEGRFAKGATVGEPEGRGAR